MLYILTFLCLNFETTGFYQFHSRGRNGPAALNVGNEEIEMISGSKKPIYLSGTS